MGDEEIKAEADEALKAGAELYGQLLTVIALRGPAALRAAIFDDLDETTARSLLMMLVMERRIAIDRTIETERAASGNGKPAL